MQKLNKTDIALEEWEFEFQQRNKNCVLMADLHCLGLHNHLASESKLNIEPYDYIFTNSDRGYVKRIKKADTLKKLRAALADGPYLSYVLTSATAKFLNFGTVMDSINSQIKRGVSDSEYISLWERFSEEYRKMMPWFYIPWYVSEENMLTDRVKSGLEKYSKEVENITDLKSALLALVFPVKKAAFQKEQKMFFALVKGAKNIRDFDQDADFKKQATDYLKEFDWVPTFYFLPLERQSYGDLVRTTQEAIKKNALDDFERTQQIKKQNAKTADELIKIFRSDPKLHGDIEAARELGWALTAGVEYAHKVGATFAPFLEAISKKIGIQQEDIQHLTAEEIRKGLERGKIDHSELKKRKQGHMYACIEGKSLISSGKEGVDISQWLDGGVRGTISNVAEFKGQPASPGTARGKVKITLSPGDSHSLKDGEILVCSMTSPDYVPAMKRAAAIITDEGGLLSHAAIMSREFGRPCIIGTKTATYILKDGDMVEVDAERGIVKILERSGENQSSNKS